MSAASTGARRPVAAVTADGPPCRSDSTSRSAAGGKRSMTTARGRTTITSADREEPAVRTDRKAHDARSDV